jgi:FKBP-type peptidyl-prolyl cis-trans isomerase
MKKRTLAGRLAAVLLVSATAVSCGDDLTMPDIDTATLTTVASGLSYRDVTVGSGAAAKAGDRASVEYAGWLTDGTLFDSGAFSFTLGIGEVVPGFDEGVTGMKVGGKRVLVIPAALGYGNQALRSIPANSTLVFEVTLQGIG